LSYLPTGTVYGTLLNFQAEWDLWGPRMGEAPYKAPPRAPVLYVKPANTWSTHESVIPVPARVAEVEVGATVAMVTGSGGAVAGYVLMNDLSVPHDSFFRPPVKSKCIDGFLGIGAEVLQASPGLEPSRFRLEVRINGVLRQRVDFSSLVRNARELLGDVQAFMSLGEGDVLMLGCDIPPGGGRPRVRSGDRIELSAPGFPSLANTLVAEAA
jgi:5-oxopent-3-ene-1,2,5-tricarboxylate decarboxylase/2-hydroxyhepta-2,4-diene-1,7-dioate isomerase